VIHPVRHVGAMDGYALADLGGADTISLAQNESAFPASPAAIAAGRAAFDQLPLYPDPEWTDMRAAIADVHGLDPDSIICGAGSMELIGCLIRAFAGAGDRVLGTDFGYAYVAAVSVQVQAGYVRAREIDMTVSVDDILAAVTRDTKIVFVCNPGNPTGTLIANRDLLRLRQQLSDDILLVIDQAYGEFSDATNDPGAVFALVARGDTVVLRTFSKAYGLAGARAGWGYFPPGIASEVRKLLNPNNISMPSQVAATAAMRDQDYMRDCVAKTVAIRNDFARKIRGIGVRVPQSHTNFLLLRFSSERTAQKANAELREDNLLMRGMGGYGLADCLRATICEKPVMDRAFDVLKGVLD